MAKNKLTGTIPDNIGALTGLRKLDLSYNSLGGSIPPSITSLTILEFLILSKDNLSGPIPSGIGDIQTLEQVFLDGNSLDGSIPSGFASLPSLCKSSRHYIFISVQLSLLSSHKRCFDIFLRCSHFTRQCFDRTASCCYQ